MSDVIFILTTPGVLLQRNHVLDRGNAYWNGFHLLHERSPLGFFELERMPQEHINCGSARRAAQREGDEMLVFDPGSAKVGISQAFQWDGSLRLQRELTSALDKSVHIAFVQRDQQIDIHRHARHTVQVHGKAAREQIPHVSLM